MYSIFKLLLIRPWDLSRVEHPYKQFYNGSSGFRQFGQWSENSDQTV